MDNATQDKKIMSLTQDDVREISTRTIRHYDQWFRKCAGVSSNLERYENGIIYLRVHTTEGKITATLETALKYAHYWINWNVELKDAQAFVVLFYTTKFTGCLVKIVDMHEDAISSLATQIQSLMRKENKLINIFSGALTAKIT